MLNLAVRNTGKLIRAKSKSENVRLGRLFTKKDTARLMASRFSFERERSAYTLLDPGAGTGILAAAAIEEICRSAKGCRQIFLTCYESNPEFIPMLTDNLERIRKKCRHDFGVRLFVTIYNENYITDAKNHYTVTFFDTVADKYDLIICNPPTELCEKGSLEAESAGGVTQTKISEAYLFAAMAASHLEEGGQLSILLPTVFASASQLGTLRRELAARLAVTGVHLFVGKQKNAKRAVPLKKNFIISYKKAEEKPESIVITTSTDNGREITALPALPYGFVVNSETGAFTLTKSVEDAKIVKYISAFPETLSSLGLKMSTGLVIDSKCPGMIFSEKREGTIPMLHRANMRSGVIDFKDDGGRFLAPTRASLMQKNKNMIIVKRIPAKSDERFVNCAIYVAASLAQYKYISTHNKINFIDTKDKNSEICARLLFGLFALLNSTIYDRYISIISKSKQINSKEMRSLPLPPRHIIENIGIRLMQERQTSVKACDSIVNPTLHIIEK